MEDVIQDLAEPSRERNLRGNGILGGRSVVGNRVFV